MSKPRRGPNAYRGKALVISVHGDPGAPPGDVQTGGQNIYVKEVASHLGRRGWSVDIYTRWAWSEAPPVEKIGRGAKIVRIAVGRKGFVPKDLLFPKLPKFIDELKRKASGDPSLRGIENYDVVHSNYWLSGWVGREISDSTGIPQVHTSHSLGKVKKARGSKVGSIMSTRILEETQTLGSAAMVIATTPSEANILEERYGVDPARIRVIPCGFDPVIFHPRGRARARAEEGLTGQKVILFAGRFDQNKGLSVLVEAFSLVVKRSPRNLVFLVAGGDPLDAVEVSREKAQVLELADRKGVLPYMRFLGPLDQESLSRYYRASDICVVPSLYESFGMVALEALACGCPVVASKAGGLAYLVRDGENGLLVPPGDPISLARRIEELLHFPRVREALSIRATRVAKRGFTWQAVADQIDKGYCEVMRDDIRKEAPVSTGD